jgi:hypothetical protein
VVTSNTALPFVIMCHVKQGREMVIVSHTYIASKQALNYLKKFVGERGPEKKTSRGFLRNKNALRHYKSRGTEKEDGYNKIC